jgi:cell shape-determining protein MreC
VPGGAQGVVKPEVGDPGDLILDFIDSTKAIHRGETVVTAGWRAGEISSAFPPNIPIGEVTRAPVVEQEATEQVHLRPFADLPNVDMIQVLTGGSRQ